MADDLVRDESGRGFGDVDRAAAPEAYVAFLGDQAERVADRKRAVNQLLGRGLGRVLDVGCGAGHDLVLLQDLLAPTGWAFGVDRSRHMAAAARERAGGHRASASASVADGAALPFAAATFDAARIERVLQHVEAPAAVVAEIGRVLRPGGVALLLDVDLGVTALTADDDEASTVVLRHRAAQRPNGYIGRDLRGLLVTAGFVDVTVDAVPRVHTTYEAADRLLGLDASVDRAVATGALDPARAEAWLADLRRRDAEDRFLFVGTFFIATGQKPRSRPADAIIR